jgi:hypothetical protein
MIRVRAEAAPLVQRLRARAARIAAGYLAARRPRRRSDWHSATALWPEFTGDRRDGK